ncbi:MAG: ABC transporter permease, partial [Eubacteriales bacterium]
MTNKTNLISRFTGSAGFKAFRAACLAIVLGLIVGFFVMLAASPASAAPGILTIITGGFRKLGDVFYYAIPIMMTGLAVGFAFKMGLFNIGASGQYTMGMFCALYAGLVLPLPSAIEGIRWVICVIAGALGGFVWGFIPGIFKALLNVNEVITSIMFNYIGMYLVDMLIMQNALLYEAEKTRTKYLPPSAQLPSLGVTGSNLNIAIFFAVIAAVILYIVMHKTTFGYEIRATGFNKHAA